MSLISDYPSDLREEHHAWHMDRAVPMGEAGSGAEFLAFHHRFLQDFHSWYDKQPVADQTAVAPWTKIPLELEVRKFGWDAELAADADRIVNKPDSFANVDELGIFIETDIHNWLHTAAAEFYNEPELSKISSANVSTYFYQIHGLVDSWWTSWLRSDAAAKLDAWFDRDGYLAAYPDVRAAGLDPLEHYRQFGWREGRDPSTAFDTKSYLAAYPDVRAAGLNPLDDFVQLGHVEGRLPYSDGVWATV